MQLNDVSTYYDRAARYYEAGRVLVFDLLLRTGHWRERTIDLLGDLSGATVLDVGVGTGANLPILAPRVGSAGRVIGVDYSEGMLARAAEIVKAKGFENVELIRGDAAKLAGIEGPVDAYVSIWCLGIVHDLEGALERGLSLLRPGGRLAIMDFCSVRPDWRPLRWLVPLYTLLLRASHIDSPEDLDDERLRRRWERARAFLEPSIEVLHEERYLAGTGFVLVGRKR